MFKELDSNVDGEIDQEEFIKLFINRTSQLKILYSDRKSIQSLKDIEPKLKEKRKNLLEQHNLNSSDWMISGLSINEFFQDKLRN